jgi:hypothetical protein
VRIADEFVFNAREARIDHEIVGLTLDRDVWDDGRRAEAGAGWKRLEMHVVHDGIIIDETNSIATLRRDIRGAELTYNAWENTRFGLQYVRYNTFNGSSTSYDVVEGRRASANNTLYAYTWLAFWDVSLSCGFDA